MLFQSLVVRAWDAIDIDSSNIHSLFSATSAGWSSLMQECQS
jgi:hypothetical protein